MSTRTDRKKCPKVAQSGKHGPALAPHVCPYACEINDDCTTECECCETCTHECAMDI